MASRTRSNNMASSWNSTLMHSYFSTRLNAVRKSAMAWRSICSARLVGPASGNRAGLPQRLFLSGAGSGHRFGRARDGLNGVFHQLRFDRRIGQVRFSVSSAGISTVTGLASTSGTSGASGVSGPSPALRRCPPRLVGATTGSVPPHQTNRACRHCKRASAACSACSRLTSSMASINDVW